jgi:hypothetical protein
MFFSIFLKTKNKNMKKRERVTDFFNVYYVYNGKKREKNAARYLGNVTGYPEQAGRYLVWFVVISSSLSAPLNLKLVQVSLP